MLILRADDALRKKTEFIAIKPQRLFQIFNTKSDEGDAWSHRGIRVGDSSHEQKRKTGYILEKELSTKRKAAAKACETRRTRASNTRGPGGFEDGWSSESVRIITFYCSERSASSCVVLGPRKSSTYSSEYASGFFEPAASHLPAAPLPRNEGLFGQTPSPIARRR